MKDRTNLLKELMANPKKSDRTIAKIVGVSQPTVTRARSYLEKHGRIKYIGVPDLHELGFEIMAFDLIIEPDADQIQKDPCIIFAVKTVEGIRVISAHKNFTDYTRWATQYVIDTAQAARFCITEEKALKELNFKDLL